MILSTVSIKRPVFTTMMSVCLIVLGIMGFTRLGTDFFPDVSFPVVLVTTVYKGAGPSEIETQIAKPIEDSVAGISGVDQIHSYSRETFSRVGGPDKVTFETKQLESTVAGNLKTVLRYQHVGITRYFDVAGFPGRSVGLPAE